MFKITHVRSLGENAQKELNSISASFLTRVKADTNPYTYLEQVLQNGSLTIKGKAIFQNINADERTFLEYLKKKFGSIITDTPADLNKHIGALNNALLGKMVPSAFGPRFKLSNFGKGVYTIFGYESYFRTKADKGIWLAKQLNIRTCPYCNAQYTLVIKKNTSGFKARFQFDHFFSKKRYPYLSISLYNLIPSCASCNLSKGDRPLQLDTHYHPYYNNISQKAHFRTIHKVDPKKISIGELPKQDLSIKFVAIDPNDKDMVEKHNDLFDIEGSYNRCTDIVENLLATAILRNDKFKDDIMKIKGLFGDNESLYYRYILGNYGLDTEISERPLAKFTQDIARQFGIIQ